VRPAIEGMSDVEKVVISNNVVADNNDVNANTIQ
jgi:hypothetical protein